MILDYAMSDKEAAPLTIGQAEEMGFFKGRIDEVTIYKRALTQAELQSIVSAGSAGKCKTPQIQPEGGGRYW